MHETLQSPARDSESDELDGTRAQPQLPSLKALRDRYVRGQRPVPAELEKRLRADARPGARAIVAAVDRRRRENRSEGQRLRRICRFERELWQRGVRYVAGVDEAGMSPLAGPVVAAAVVLPVGYRLVGVDDSKCVPEPGRNRLRAQIVQDAVCWSVGIATPTDIDQVNIYWAGLLAMERAVAGLHTQPQHLLVDARSLKNVSISQRAIVHGDRESISIAAASIVAKTTRDALMIELDRAHPEYGFARHKGYPVREHYEALRRHGPCPAHRRSFRPVQEAGCAGGP